MKMLSVIIYNTSKHGSIHVIREIGFLSIQDTYGNVSRMTRLIIISKMNHQKIHFSCVDFKVATNKIQIMSKLHTKQIQNRYKTDTKQLQT